MSTRISLTDLAVRAAKAPQTGTTTLWDSNVRGLGLRCSQGGTKTFIVMLGRERSRVSIGRYPHWSVKDARAEALRIIADRAGKPARKRVSFEQAFETFKRTHTVHYRPQVRAETERVIRKHLIPHLNTKAIAGITTEDLTRITDALINKPGTCAHVHGAARTLFRWAVKRRLIDRSPLEGIGTPVPLITRDRVLSPEELRLVYYKAASLRSLGGKIVQLLVLSGQRRGEIAALRGEYINRDARTITFPADFTKNGRSHTFPYGSMAARIFEDLPREATSSPLAEPIAVGRTTDGRNSKLVFKLK